MRNTLERLYTYVPWVLGIIILALLWGIAHTVLNRPQAGGPSIEATPAPEVRSAPSTRVPSAPVRVYTGDTKAKLKLPPEVIVNPNQQVIAATRVPADPRPQTVTTVIDTATGDSQSYVKVDPYPLFAIEARGEASLAYGLKLRNGIQTQVARAQISYDVVRVKALTVGVVGSADSDGDAFIGARVAYRW